MMKVLHIDTDINHFNLTKNQIVSLAPATELLYSSSFANLHLRLKIESFDCILTDEETLKVSGNDILRKLRQAKINIPFIILSDMFSEKGREFSHNVLQDDQLSMRIIYCRYDLLAYWIEKLVESCHHTLSEQASLNSVQNLRNLLTEREFQILEMIASGSSNKEIAYDLDISYRTVVNHVYNLYQKLKVNSRVEATQCFNGMKKPG